MRAFVLGAGLGTRLRPLTDDRPKPLVPVFDKPLITFAFDHLMGRNVRGFVVNTHHRPKAYEDILGARDGRMDYRGCEVRFRFEPELLDTGGGIKNVEGDVGSEDFWVHNGDVIADLDLARMEEVHRKAGNAVTLGLRSTGGPLHVAFDPKPGKILDIRGTLAAPAPMLCLFTGISILSTRVFAYLEAGRPASIIPALLEMMRAGEKVGGCLLDDGLWLDLGTPDAYVGAHRLLVGPCKPGYCPPDWPLPMHPSARVAGDAELEGFNAIGAEAIVGAGARLRNCVVWRGAEISPGSRLRDCIVRRFAAGSAESAIL